MTIIIYITGFIVCLIYDVTLIVSGLKIKQGKLIIEVLESLFWFITLPISLVGSIYLRKKGIKIFRV